MSDRPSAKWEAKADIPLSTLLLQMADQRFDYVEMAMGPLTVSITIVDSKRQPALRDRVSAFLQEGK